VDEKKSGFVICVYGLKLRFYPHLTCWTNKSKLEERVKVFFSTPNIDASIMDSDEDTTMMDVDFPTSLSKGKGKAVNHDVPIDNDNLPWYLFFIEPDTASLSFHTEGSKNTDR
jgi:hypothetical protein